ncbi:PfkB family carbohydrate kinase [Streptomyces sp. NBC_01537]|uniref:PfkB family carbohydrate kinase n=1 Tax=Streptomyces sp. NBC_01537 TaxID=2903896 RepID=UPI00386ADDC2
MPRALFVGLCTLDLIQLVPHVPAANEKLTALAQLTAAGGPATNAAATYSHLGSDATLLTAIGSHPLAAAITHDLANLGVNVIDLTQASPEPPALSSILVTAGTGERAVASINASQHSALPLPRDPAALIEAASLVAFDAHHMDLALAVAPAARALGCLTLLDGGSWKPRTEHLLPSIDVAVCSADFHPPAAPSPTPSGTLAYLHAQGVPYAAITRGPAPILWSTPDATGELPVPHLPVLDTLGAGDVLHGALAHHLADAAPLDTHRFTRALAQAAEVASRACASFGTRAWMEAPVPPGLP